MKRKLLGSAAFCGAFALATGALALDDIDLDLSGYIAGAAGIRVEADTDYTRDYTFGLDSEVHLEGSYIFGNGLQLGVQVGGKLNRVADDLKRDQTDTVPGETAVVGAGIDSACGKIAGYFGGYLWDFCVAGSAGDDFLQESFAFFEGAFGRLEVGRQYGIGYQMSFLAPTIFRSTNINDWEIDFSGVNTVNTRNTANNGFDDRSPKIVYMVPRVFGFQGGVSYSPDSNGCGYDFCPHTDDMPPPSHDGVLELGANFYHTFSNGTLEGLSIGVGGTYLMASSKSKTTTATVLGIDDYEAWNVGASVVINGFTFGGSFKNAELPVSGYNYYAYDVGATYERGPWGVMVSYGADDNQLTGQETVAVQCGVDFMLGGGVSVGIGAQYVDANFETLPLLSVAGLNSPFADIESTAVFIETDISF